MKEEEVPSSNPNPIPEPPQSRRNRLQSHFKGLHHKILKNLGHYVSKDKFLKVIQNFDPQATLDWVSKAVQKRGTSFYGTLITIILSTYSLANLTALLTEQYIPDPPLNRSDTLHNRFGRMGSADENEVIFSRNLFNSKGIIPGEGQEGPNDIGGPAVKTSLPLKLIGTLIMTNEKRSIATIEDSAASLVYPVRVDDEIPGKIKVLIIEPKKVTFINSSSGRREYVEIADTGNQPKIGLGRSTGSAGSGIERVNPSQFNVSRSEVDKALADFNNILTQARAVPNFENGVANGYKIFQIVPGSIYEKLGIQNGDIITGVNGQPMTDPSKAFEMFSDVKNGANHLELQIKRDGKVQNYSYDMH